MARVLLVLVFIMFLGMLIRSTHPLHNSETQVLQQLRKQMEYPKRLDAWNYIEDLCYTPSSSGLVVACEGDAVTELKIIGDKVVKPDKYEGYPIADQTLSKYFSVDSFFTTLTRLPSLKVVILVSLGIWGSLPDKIHRLDSLEVLDLSSNYLYGSIPAKISAMSRLQTLTLDGNYFNETVPDWLDSLTNLTGLSLQKNRLKGPLALSIGRISTLTDLALSNNNISGGLPDLSNLTSLKVLDMRDNELDSDIPVMPQGLVTVLLSNNSLTGEVPLQLGELSQLQHLDLSFNLLEGSLPESLFSLPNISYLNLASNMLTGSLSNDISCSSQLGFVDISTNRLTSSLPSCLSSDSNKRIVKFDGNCLTAEPRHQHDAGYCQASHKNGKGSKSKSIGLMVTAIAAVTALTLLLLLVLLILWRRNRNQAISEQHLLPKSVPDNSATGFSTELLANARYISQTINLGTQVMPTYRVFSIEELKEATRNFERSSYIGEGSVGKLYKGQLENGTLVAVRCLALFKRYSIRNLKLRLDLLSKLRHPHLICLLGHCIDGATDDAGLSRVFLVYEYVSNSSLRVHLSNRCPERILKWIDRLAILTCVAKAIHFLHTGIMPGFFNNRLRTNNILLDEHNVPKVSDYGLSIITEEIYKRESRADKKSIENKSPALEMVKLEDDIYSFGLIVLEALCGSSVSETGVAFCLSQLATPISSQEQQKHIVDPIVLNTSSQESLSIVVSITSKCLSSESSMRPSVEDVLWNLQYASQVHATADGDQSQRSDVVSQHDVDFKCKATENTMFEK